MQRSIPQHRRWRQHPFNRITLATWLLLLTTTATAADAPTVVDATTDTSAEKTSPVVHELLEIQRRLGGSLVANRDSLREYSSPANVAQAEPTRPLDTAVRFRHIAGPRRANSETAFSAVGQVESLRNAAWQLAKSAEQLERSELYQQADALRDLAQLLRKDARASRAQLAGPDSRYRQTP